MREFLMAAGANPDIASNSGFTPLMRAVFDGNLPAARSLVSAQVHLESRNREGWTALHLTANLAKHGGRSQDQALVRLLVEAGANLNARENKGRTPLNLSVVNSRSAVLELLLASGADPDIGDKRGITPLLNAVYDGNFAAVQALVAAGADVAAVNDRGWSALHYTANSVANRVVNSAERRGWSRDEATARLLIESGVNVNARDNYGFTPLFLSVANNREEIRDLLLAAGANPDIANVDGCTPLMRAASDSDLPAARALLAAKASLTATDKAGRSALQYVAGHSGKDDRSKPEAMERLLIAAGAGPSNHQRSPDPDPSYCR
ncbi:ankyrin repeat domain-containing protein [Microbulbifer taiwanensis]